MNCINYNNKEYKQLLSATGLSKMSLNAVIMKYQNDNNVDSYPTLRYIKDNKVTLDNDIDIVSNTSTSIRLNEHVINMFKNGSSMTSEQAFDYLLTQYPKDSFEYSEITFFKKMAKKQGMNIPVYRATLDDTITQGFYENDSITINDKTNSDKNYVNSTLLHELLHAVFSDLELNSSFSKQVGEFHEKTIKELSKKYLNNKSFQNTADDFYGLRTYDDARPYSEFISEFFSNPEFRKHLSEIDINDNFIKEYFKRLINYIGNLLGINRLSAYGSNDTFVNDIAEYLIESLRNYDGVYLYGNRSNAAKREALTSDLSSFQRVFDSENNKITFIEGDHKYINNNTGEQYTSVSDVKKLTGYGDEFDSVPTSLQASLAAPVGTGVHSFVLEKLTSRRVTESEKFPMSKSAVSDMNQILKDLLPTGTIVISVEQMISNDNKMIAGTLDMLVKLSDGTIRLIDFKTKITKANFRDEKSKNPWLNYERTFMDRKKKTVGKSQRVKHDFQQTAYKEMLNDLGLTVDQKGIVPLEISLIEDSNSPTGYVIDGVKITKALKTSDNKDTGIGYYELRDNIKVINDVRASLGISTSENQEDLIKIQELERLQEIAENGLTLLKKRSSKYNIIGEETRGSILEQDVLIMESLSNSEVVIGIVNAAFRELQPIVKTYNDLIDREHTDGSVNWNIKVLQSWNDYANAFDVLNDIRDFVQEFPKALETTPSFDYSDFTELLDQAISYRDKIASALKIKGKPVWEKWIGFYSDAVEASYRRNAELEFKKNWTNDNPKGKWTNDVNDSMLKYVEEYMIKNADTINAEKRSFISKNAKVCYQDANGFAKYVSSIFDTKDPIIGAMAKAYYENMIDYRQTYVLWYQEMIDLVRDFEKSTSKSSYADNKKLYDYMLDYDANGAKLVTQRPISFDNAYKTVQEEARTNELFTPQQRYEHVSKWLNKNAPIKNQNGLNDALREYYNRLLADNVLTKSEHAFLIDNEFGENQRSIKNLAYTGDIRYDVVDEIYMDRNEIYWQFREIDKKKYPNVKYDNLMKMSKDDIKFKMYDFFVRMSKRGDSSIANRLKLNFYLPGITKSLSERIVGGENAITATKTEILHEIKDLRPDDTGYGMMLGDESDKQIDVVPVYFTSRLSDNDQSYDLPTIYNEWFKSAMNYEMVNNILPMLEYTKRIINDRKVLKFDRHNKLAQNILGTMWSDRNPQSTIADNYIESTNNHLADMLNAWFKQVIYDKSDNLSVTHSKVIKMINQFNSVRVMGLNLYSMINNFAMAEVNQAIEVVSGSLMTAANYTLASKEYMRLMPSIVGDVGSRKPTSKINLLNEFFGVFDDFGDGKIRDKSIAKRLFYSSTLYFTTNLGEHMAQSRFLIGALMNIEAFDKDGKSLGNMYQNYNVNDSGRLELNPNVANFTKSDEMKLRRKLTSTLRGLHGNYANYSRVAMQQNGYTALALQFRKWIMPGVERRWRNEYYDEFASEYKQGYYKAGASYYFNNAKLAIMQMQQFFGKLSDESKMLDLISKSDYRQLSKSQQEGIKRLSTDLGVFLTLSLLILALGAIDDDDKNQLVKKSPLLSQDNSMTKFALNHFFYQAYRLQTEQLSFINPIDALKIIKSPVAATTTLTDTAKLFNQVLPWNVTETYRSGTHKGRNKAVVLTMKQAPVVRQLLRWMDPTAQRKALDLTL